MSKNNKESAEDRNKRIYKLYKSDIPIETICSIFELKMRYIVRVINHYNRLETIRNGIMEDIHDCLHKSYGPKRLNITTRVYNGLFRYLRSNNIYTESEIKELINSNTYIRNVGEKSREIIIEFFKE